jgi:UDP-N-acetylglucosamine 1-carboxyvinyltransferase
MAFSLTCAGQCKVVDSVYPERFMHVDELNRLGAGIRRQGFEACLSGPTPLSGAPVLASDLRASAALVLAGMAASGNTTVRRVYHLDRGYEQLEVKLQQLGARVQRCVDEQSP